MVSISMLGDLNCSIPPKILKRFNAKKDEFQMMPEAASKALQMVKDPSCEVALVARTIEKDIKLSASILTLANCPLYSAGRPITCVRDAIINVGFRQCQTLIQTCCAKSLMQSVAIDQAVGEIVMQHCLATAAIASSMNKHLGLSFQGEEFTAGLLHDLGRMLLGALFPEELPKLHEIQMQSTADSLLQEQEMIGTDHALLGCYFAIANRLPDELAEAIRFHHSPMEATCEPRLTATTAVAAEMADHLLAESGEEYDVALNAHVSVFEESCGYEQRANLEIESPNILAAAIEILSSLKRPS